jgi:hypothetical protein
VGFKIRKPSSARSRSRVVGDKEIERETSLRNRKKGDLGPSSVEDLASTLERLVREKPCQNAAGCCSPARQHPPSPGARRAGARSELERHWWQSPPPRHNIP